jgi:hypothetical protein
MSARIGWSDRQLRLFETGKIPRGCKLGGRSPPPIERRTAIALADTLRKLARPGWFWTYIASGELRPEGTGGLLQRLGLKRGLPDYLLISPAGVHYWLELKRVRLGMVSDDQLQFAGMCQARAIPHAICRGFKEAEAQLREWDVLRPDATRIG